MRSIKKMLALLLTAAMLLTLFAAVPVSAADYPLTITEITSSNGSVTSVIAEAAAETGGTARALVGVYENDALVNFGMSDVTAYNETGTAEFEIPNGVSYSEDQKVTAYIWSCGINGDLTMIPLADSMELKAS